jgi:hypothetical protein
MSIATFATFGLIQHRHRHELTLLMTCDDHLGYTLPIVDNKILL